MTSAPHQNLSNSRGSVSHIQDTSTLDHMARPGKVFLGPIIHFLSPSELEIIPFALLAVNHEGQVTSVHKSANAQQLEDTLAALNISPDLVTIHRLGPSQFLIPGFVGTHNHAPQLVQHGLGPQMHFLDWLDAITFPNDPVRRCVDGFLRQGITTASYYGSCNMSRNPLNYYRDASVEESLRVTEDCIVHIRSIGPAGRLVRHILTPRYAISCHPELLQGLGDIACANPDLPVQTHFNEAEQEMKVTRELFPQFSNEADLYEHYGLLGKRSIMAHCCHMTEYELGRLKALDCGVAYCPAAPVRNFMRRGIKVGLGTDSGGGFSSSILDALRLAMIPSHAREVMSIDEAFHLATVGGARVCGLGDRIGSFEVRKEFDAIVVGTQRAEQGIMTLVEEGDTLRSVFEKFVVMGDDRNVVEAYVQGRLVKGRA
ncbi:Metallo-dependent hydrolase [Parathielavia appendiculata]|uniref:Metallo-dependent hydrolase n=1 Tax=Parathielavia appendiculata TaxID=2587402 RepID=A0AAN6TP94_9PEZI|nr:Metallo-dependent hydrolase [Parathielavia appendiculata]